jgi:trans-2,3-dihydro-3-hydroxyanthranilate isomerase
MNTAASLRFRTADVFTSRRYAGNPLAFVPDAAGLETEVLGAIAREFNLSETVFVTAASTDRRRFDVRIFTPASEIPFAGHPTVGCAILLVEDGKVELNAAGTAEIVLVEQAGEVPVRIRRDGSGLWARFTAPAIPKLIPIDIPARDAAAMLGLPAGAVLCDPTAFGVGLGFLFVQLGDLEALARASLDPGHWRRLVGGSQASQIYPYVRTPGAIRARMFAPDQGIIEDPATGSAAVALAGLLAGRSQDGAHAWTIHQGVEMGRPSLIKLFADVVGGAPTRIEVEGRAVPLSEGVLLAPEM